MEISIRKITREDFVSAINTAEAVVKELHPRSRLAYYCGVFMEKNKQLAKLHDRASKSATKKRITENNNFKADNATEKEGILVTNEKGEYQYSKAAAKLIMEENFKFSEDINLIVDEFMKEEIEVKCITTQFVLDSKERPTPGTFMLPPTITDDIIKSLNKFVFKYTNEFEEEIKEL